MYYYVHMFRRLRKILSSQLLLNIYKSYVQSKIDYELSIWGCTTEANLDRMQRIQNLLARIIVLAEAKTFNSDFCRQVTNALY